MKSLLISVFLFSVAATETFSQTKLREHVWPETTPTTTIPDSLNDDDAVMVHYQHDIKNYLDLSAGQAFNIENIRSRVKLNTQAGLENYSTYSFLKSKYNKLTKLDARTIKQNGKIIDLTTSEIKILDIKPDAERNGYENVRVSIPGAEVGDEVEIIYTLESDGFNTSEDVHLYTNIPTLKSVFSYTSDDIIVTEFRMYNDMPDPVIKRAMKDAVFTWTLTNLPGVGDQFSSNFTESLPFIRFTLRQIILDGQPMEGLAKWGITKNNWSEIYDNYVKVYENAGFGRAYKGKSFVGYMNTYKEKNPTLTIDQKVSWLINLINDSLEIVDFKEDEKYLSAMYYIQYKKIDENNIHNLLRSFFQENNIKFYVAFGRERIEGVLDVNFASGGMINEVFYVTENEKGELHFIYPSNTIKRYYIDEMPYRLTGTEVILVSRKSDNSSASDVKKIRIPMNEMNANVRSTMMNIQIKLNDKKVTFKTKNSYTGDFSTAYREFINNATEAKDPNKDFAECLGLSDQLKIDTFTIVNSSSTYPFIYSFNYEGKSELAIQKLEQSVYSIPLDGILDHYTLKTNSQKRMLNYYCPFKYQDNFEIYLQFDKPVEIMENTLEELWWFKPISNYIINVTKVNDKIILIESKLDLRKEKLNPNEYIQLNKINESVKQASQSRILIKTL